MSPGESKLYGTEHSEDKQINDFVSENKDSKIIFVSSKKELKL